MDRLALRHKLFLDDFLEIEKTNQKTFNIRLTRFCFLDLEEVEVYHVPENGDHFQPIPKSQRIILLMFLWSCEMFFGTILRRFFQFFYTLVRV